MGLKLDQCNAKLRRQIAEAIEAQDRGKSQSPVTQPIVCHEPVAEEKGKNGDTERLHVRVISYRKRLCDADNLCPKYFVDCLRYAGIIKDDSAKYITLEVSQEQSKEERTVIEITAAAPCSRDL